MSLLFGKTQRPPSSINTGNNSENLAETWAGFSGDTESTSTPGDKNDTENAEGGESYAVFDTNEDIGFTVSDSDNDQSQHSSSTDDDPPQLIPRFKHDTDSIEKEEEQAIIRDMERKPGKRGHGSGQASHIESNVKNESDTNTDSEDNGEDDDDDDDESSSDDFMVDLFDTVPRDVRGREEDIQHENVGGQLDEDDSFLWEYFFSDSSEEEEVSFMDHNNDTLQDTSPGFSTIPASVPPSDTRPHSGESTDEDTDLPPSTKRGKPSRAVEVLGSGSQSTRPPVLCTWNLDESRGRIGVIDGLTTRSLSPNDSNRRRRRGSSSSTGTRNIRRPPSREAQEQAEDLGEIAFEEFINTDELKYISEVSDRGYESPLIYRRGINVPLSAFRNKNGVDAARRSRRRSFGVGAKEVVISPLRPICKRGRKLKGSHMKRGVDQSFGHDDNVLDDFFDVGTIGPLFEI